MPDQALRVAVVDVAGTISPETLDWLRSAGMNAVPGRRSTRLTRADVVLVGLDFDAPVPPLAALARWTRSHRVLVVASSRLRTDIAAARAHGARGYLSPGCGQDALLRAVEAVASGAEDWPIGFALDAPLPAAELNRRPHRSRLAEPSRLRHRSRLAALFPAASLPMVAWPPWTLTEAAIALSSTVIAWLVWRRIATRHAAEVADSCELVRIHERTRYSRLLHDRALQALEVLATSPEIRDHTLRAHLAEEATWLRHLVEHGETEPQNDLTTAIEAVVGRQPLGAVDVSLSFDAGWVAPRIPPAAVDALAGAVTEALTNVAKHASAARAEVVLAARAGAIVVTVVDDGAGFDPTERERGFGLTHSIENRMAAAGGTAQVWTARGCGTLVELRYPIQTRAASTDGDLVSTGRR